MHQIRSYSTEIIGRGEVQEGHVARGATRAGTLTSTRRSAVHWNNLKLAHWLNSKLKSLPCVWSMDNLGELKRWSSLVRPLSSC